jgi:hypothetical protein
VSKQAAIVTTGLIGLSAALGCALAGWPVAGVALFIATGPTALVVSGTFTREPTSPRSSTRNPEQVARHERAVAMDGRVFSIYGQWVMTSTVCSVVALPALAAGAVYLQLAVVGQVVVLGQLWAIWWAFLEQVRMYKGGERDLWNCRGLGRRVLATLLAIYGSFCTAVLVAICLEWGSRWQVVGIALLVAVDVGATVRVFRRARHGSAA